MVPGLPTLGHHETQGRLKINRLERDIGCVDNSTQECSRHFIRFDRTLSFGGSSHRDLYSPSFHIKLQHPSSLTAGSSHRKTNRDDVFVIDLFLLRGGTPLFVTFFTYTPT